MVSQKRSATNRFIGFVALLNWNFALAFRPELNDGKLLSERGNDKISLDITGSKTQMLAGKGVLDSPEFPITNYPVWSKFWKDQPWDGSKVASQGTSSFTSVTNLCSIFGIDTWDKDSVLQSFAGAHAPGSDEKTAGKGGASFYVSGDGSLMAKSLSATELKFADSIVDELRNRHDMKSGTRSLLVPILYLFRHCTALKSCVGWMISPMMKPVTPGDAVRKYDLKGVHDFGFGMIRLDSQEDDFYKQYPDGLSIGDEPHNHLRSTMENALAVLKAVESYDYSVLLITSPPHPSKDCAADAAGPAVFPAVYSDVVSHSSGTPYDVCVTLGIIDYLGNRFSDNLLVKHHPTLVSDYAAKFVRAVLADGDHVAFLNRRKAVLEDVALLKRLNSRGATQ